MSGLLNHIRFRQIVLVTLAALALGTLATEFGVFTAQEIGDMGDAGDLGAMVEVECYKCMPTNVPGGGEDCVTQGFVDESLGESCGPSEFGDDPQCGNTCEAPIADACPDDPNKLDPGICGCGTPDTDGDGDGIIDCQECVAPGEVKCSTNDGSKLICCTAPRDTCLIGYNGVTGEESVSCQQGCASDADCADFEYPREGCFEAYCGESFTCETRLICDSGDHCYEIEDKPGEFECRECKDPPCDAGGTTSDPPPPDGEPCEGLTGCNRDICLGNLFVCDDGDKCTQDYCNAGNSECVNIPWVVPIDGCYETTNGSTGGDDGGGERKCKYGSFCRNNSCTFVAACSTVNEPPDIPMECNSSNACGPEGSSSSSSSSGDEYMCCSGSCIKIGDPFDGVCASPAMSADACNQSCGGDNPTHTECINDACTEVAGEGEDACANDNECLTETHGVCHGTTCAQEPGTGTDQCSADADCTTSSVSSRASVAISSSSFSVSSFSFESVSSAEFSSSSSVSSTELSSQSSSSLLSEIAFSSASSALDIERSSSSDDSETSSLSSSFGVPIAVSAFSSSSSSVEKDTSSESTVTSSSSSVIAVILSESSSADTGDTDDDGDGDNDDGQLGNQDDDDDGNGDNDDGIPGNGSDADGSSSFSRSTAFSQPRLVAAAAICGNGVLEQGEECDDTNRRNDDGCNAECLLEIGICGDGRVQQLLGEQCEQRTFDTSLPFSCVRCRFVSTTCGDGTVDAGEECDEGLSNSTSPDANCRPDCSFGRCGDGVLDGTELCDDGNRLNGDGCDRYCINESTQVAAEATSSAQSILFDQYGATTIPFGGFQQVQFPYAQSQLPLAQLQPLIQGTAPVGDTGPAAVAVIGAGAAAGFSWMRRRRKKQ